MKKPNGFTHPLDLAWRESDLVKRLVAVIQHAVEALLKLNSGFSQTQKMKESA